MLIAASRRSSNFIHYGLFVSYFPHLIAGPVPYHKEIMPQFDKPETYRLDLANVAVGITWFAIGLFKKVVLVTESRTMRIGSSRSGRKGTC